MTFKAFDIQAQLAQDFIIDDEGNMRPAAVGEGFTEESSTTFGEPSTEETPQQDAPPASTTIEPSIGEAEWTDSTMEFPPSTEMEQATSSASTTETEVVPAESQQSSEPFAGKTFYRAGKEATMTTDSSTLSVPEPVEPESVEPEPEELVPVDTETGTVLGTEDTTVADTPDPTDTPVVTEKASLMSFIKQSTPLLVMVAVVVGGAMYFLFLRKKTPSLKGVGAGAPTPIAPAASVEQSSPRLEQALKAIQAEQSSTSTPTIPQEGSSPAAA